MDALIAKADARPRSKRKANPKSGGKSRPAASRAQDDKTVQSIARQTQLPASLRRAAAPSTDKGKGKADGFTHIPDRKLRTHLVRQSANAADAHAFVRDAQELLDMGLGDEAGAMAADGELERTWRVGQDEIVKSVGLEAANGRREWALDGGTYRLRYTRNGRHMGVIGSLGHAATFDWRTGGLHAELQLKETCRDITFLHDQSHFAVAQSKYVFIYDRNGIELHRLKSHIEPVRLEFLPYHWLLVSVGNPGYLKYQDTSTGQLIVEHRTKLGACHTMAQNLHNAVIHLGHQNGTVTLWTPNMSEPLVRLLAHMGPVTSLAMDPSTGGRYMATAGHDGRVKVWDCRNWKGCVREWSARGGPGEVEWSARGFLAVASGGTVNVYGPKAIHTAHAEPAPPPLYLTHPLPRRPLAGLRFCPFTDILTIGHSAGLSSILVPGSGEPNFDSAEADPFEGRKRRREREVRGLFDKIQPDLIALDPEFVGGLAPPPKASLADEEKATPFTRLPRLERLRVEGKADETEVVRDDEDDADANDVEKDAGAKSRTKKEKVTKKTRGKESSMKKYLKKKRKNVIDPQTERIRQKLDAQRKERKLRERAAAGLDKDDAKPSVLDRFKY